MLDSIFKKIVFGENNILPLPTVEVKTANAGEGSKEFAYASSSDIFLKNNAEGLPLRFLVVSIDF